MNITPLSQKEMEEARPGEALTLTTVFVVFTVVILTVVAYRLFISGDSKITLPGGYKFEWGD